VPESDHPTSDHPTSDTPSDRTSDNPHFPVPQLDPHDLLDPPANEQWPSDPLPELEHDLEVLSWLACSPQLGEEVTGYLCDALAAWALAGHGYPQMALPEAGPNCDHLQALKVIIDRIPQRIIDADSIAQKMDLGRFGRLLSRAFWASWDPQAVLESVDRELVTTMPWLAGPPAPYRLPGGGTL